MRMIPLNIPHPRPKVLSDPFHDFREQDLIKLIETPDEKMKWFHFKQILGPFLPAGTYEEAAYFLPLAFDHILSHDDDALDLVTPLTGFISEYYENLSADGALEASRVKIRHCLDHWSKDFRVIHFNRAGCKEKQWGLHYFDYVSLSETIAEGSCDLVRFTVHADIAIQFYQRISRDDAGPTEAAWYLELARQHYTDDVYKPPNQTEIRGLLEDQDIAERCAQTVTSGLDGFAESPSYWRDAFNALAIETVPIPEWSEPKTSE